MSINNLLAAYVGTQNISKVYFGNLEVTAFGPSDIPPLPPPTFDDDAYAQFLLNTTTPELSGLINGLPGGATNMELWSQRNVTIPSYTRNPNFWALPLVNQLTGAAAYKDDVTGAKQSYGGILISPRHLLYCDHAKPHAANTWSIAPNNTKPCKIQFVLGNGDVVEAIQLAQTSRRTTKDRPGAYTPEDWPEGATAAPDLCVAVLDRDVEVLGCHVMPIPTLSKGVLQRITTLNIPTLNVTQGYERSTNTIPPIPISDYPQYHNAMLAIGRGNLSLTPYSLFDYTVWDGDSGTPAMLLINGILYLERILLWSGGGGRQPSGSLDHINAMLQVADADAVERGKMAEPTGIVIESVDIPLPS
jgi:hypothetical protein